MHARCGGKIMNTSYCALGVLHVHHVHVHSTCKDGCVTKGKNSMRRPQRRTRPDVSSQTSFFFLYSTDRSVYEHGFLSLIGVDADRLLSVEIGQRSLLMGQSRRVDRLGTIEENKTETVRCKSRVISNLVGG
jgi:hypothetical protein